MPKKIEIDSEVFELEQFLSEEECRSLIEMAEKKGFSDAMIISDGKPIVAKEIRNNQRVLVDDFKLANKIWARAKPYVPALLDSCKVMGLNERFRFYRYEKNQIFRLHKDFPFSRKGQRSKLTIIIYLNDNFDGGQTDFRKFQVEPKTGSALIFRHELLHEGSAVMKGVKYAVRTDIMYESSI